MSSGALKDQPKQSARAVALVTPSPLQSLDSDLPFEQLGRVKNRSILFNQRELGI